jgi:hypothetical protein
MLALHSRIDFIPSRLPQAQRAVVFIPSLRACSRVSIIPDKTSTARLVNVPKGPRNASGLSELDSLKGETMQRKPPWTEESDAEFKRLAERSYSIARLSVAMKRSRYFTRRATDLGVRLKKPQRLPCEERIYGGGAERNPRVRNSS